MFRRYFVFKAITCFGRVSSFSLSNSCEHKSCFSWLTFNPITSTKSTPETGLRPFSALLVGLRSYPLTHRDKCNVLSFLGVCEMHHSKSTSSLNVFFNIAKPNWSNLIWSNWTRTVFAWTFPAALVRGQIHKINYLIHKCLLLTPTCSQTDLICPHLVLDLIYAFKNYG